MDHAEKCAMLWKVIGRFDGYIKSANTKATLLSTFNLFVVGSTLSSWHALEDFFSPTLPMWLAHSALLLAVAGALVSLVFAFLAVNPFLGSSTKPPEFYSNIFFEDVSKHSTPETYIERLDKVDTSALFRDLGTQAHALAEGTSKKFEHLCMAFGAVIVSLLFFLLLLLARAAATIA